jgi:hypothetical protein
MVFYTDMILLACFFSNMSKVTVSAMFISSLYTAVFRACVAIWFKVCVVF